LVTGRRRLGLHESRFWGVHTGPNPTDRAKRGCKRHLVTDAQGIPLVVQVGPANVHDSIPTLDLLDSIPPIQGPLGRPRFRPEILQGDRAYGTPDVLTGVRERGVHPLIPKINDQTHGSGLGKFRYVVERTLAWFGHNRRLKLCYERTGEHLQALHDLAAAFICANRLVSIKGVVH
jgi:transposase